MYSFGGYHADDDQRTVRQADSQGGPLFTSQPIDVHCCDCGEERVKPITCTKGVACVMITYKVSLQILFTLEFLEKGEFLCCSKGLMEVFSSC